MTYHAAVRRDVPETCPKIDAVIKAIDQALEYCHKHDKEHDAFDYIRYELCDLEDHLEELRRSNTTLRDLACEAMKESKRQEAILDRIDADVLKAAEARP